MAFGQDAVVPMVDIHPNWAKWDGGPIGFNYQLAVKVPFTVFTAISKSGHNKPYVKVYETGAISVPNPELQGYFKQLLNLPLLPGDYLAVEIEHMTMEGAVCFMFKHTSSVIKGLYPSGATLTQQKQEPYAAPQEPSMKAELLEAEQRAASLYEQLSRLRKAVDKVLAMKSEGVWLVTAESLGELELVADSIHYEGVKPPPKLVGMDYGTLESKIVAMGGVGMAEAQLSQLLYGESAFHFASKKDPGAILNLEVKKEKYMPLQITVVDYASDKEENPNFNYHGLKSAKGPKFKSKKW